MAPVKVKHHFLRVQAPEKLHLLIAIAAQRHEKQHGCYSERLRGLIIESESIAADSMLRQLCSRHHAEYKDTGMFHNSRTLAAP